MDIIEQVSKIFLEANAYTKTNNYHFENHICPSTGKNVKVDLEYKLKSEKKGNIVMIGICPHCKTAYYHEDFDTSSR